MSRRRFIADESSGDHAALLGAHANHLTHVLRARIGQEFDIAAGGRVRRGRVVNITDDRVDFALGEEVLYPPLIPVTLWLAVFKFDRMEWAIEKCTELGVSRIVPLVTRRTDVHLTSAAAKRCERWRRIVLQASEQSRRAEPPVISAPAELKRETLLTPAPAHELQIASTRVVLAESQRDITLRQALRAPEGVRPYEVHLAVGPEGGWTDAELGLFENSGWIQASLGNTILRTETAAIAAMAVVRSLLD
jgi:16S rRNA (uracil1498-N3)-methyltransferase